MSQEAEPLPQFDPGPVPQLAWLPVMRLIVDPAYQRSIETPRSKRLIRHIADKFCWIAFGALMAAPDDKPEWWRLVDGQHRNEAAKLRGIALVPCVVNPATSGAAAAAAFIGMNRDRARIDDFALHKAMLAAGNDRAQRIEALTRTAGIAIPRSNPSSFARKPGEVGAIAVFGRLLDRYPLVAADACGAVADAYGSEVGGLRAPFFEAAAMLLAAGETDRAQLAAGFRQTSAAAFYDGFAPREGRLTRVAATIGILRGRLGIAPAADASEPKAANPAASPLKVGPPPTIKHAAETAKPRLSFGLTASPPAQPAAPELTAAAAAERVVAAPIEQSRMRRPDSVSDLLAWRRYCGDAVKPAGAEMWQVNGASPISTAELIRRTNNLRRSTGGRPYEIALEEHAPIAAGAAS